MYGTRKIINRLRVYSSVGRYIAICNMSLRFEPEISHFFTLRSEIVAAKLLDKKIINHHNEFLHYFISMLISFPNICSYFILCRRMSGKELDGLGLKELQHLENQLCEGICAVKNKKVQITKTKVM
jgi:hypothetical protein